MSALLFELGVEEIPAGYVRPALETLAARFREAMADVRLHVGDIRTAATPRRLTLFADGLPERQEDVEALVQGPPAKIAFDDDGNPTRAGVGFAKSQGVEVHALERRDTDKGSYCCAMKREEGQAAADVLAAVLADVVAALPFPKSMRWVGSDGRFPRPVRHVLALLDDAVLDLTLFGRRAGRGTPGHPFLAPDMIQLDLANYDEYVEALRGAFVMADVQERTDAVRAAIAERMQALTGDGAIRDTDLLDEVVMLIEWPLVVEGAFDEAFLAVPAPIIEAAMMGHQRYFPVRHPDGSPANRFLTVANRREDTDGLIREGNERVLQARLNDARFFWESDAQQTLADRVEQLTQVQFLKGLGTYHDKARRLQALAGRLAEACGVSAEERGHAERAALLCKSDLLTEMVGEFPALQGVVGRLCAQREGEPDAVAAAIEEHYQPRSAADPLPNSTPGRIVALAEKLDNLAGGFALNLAPTGSQDPYGLRRQAHAVVRLAEASAGPALDALVAAAFDMLDHENRPEAEPALCGFIQDRLYQMSLDRGAPHDIARAAMAAGWADVSDLFARIDALRALSGRPEWPGLVAVVERTFNIGRAAASADVDASLLEQDEEKVLWRVYTENADDVRALIDRADYAAAALRYAKDFADPVHVFFDKVFVNVDDERVRNNRLGLMQAVNRLFSERIADLSEIVTGVDR